MFVCLHAQAMHRVATATDHSIAPAGLDSQVPEGAATASMSTNVNWALMPAQ